MRTLTPGLAAHLAGGATTLARCWRLTRADGVALGFTDHDRALAFDATTFEPSAGFVASEVPVALGLAVVFEIVLGRFDVVAKTAEFVWFFGILAAVVGVSAAGRSVEKMRSGVLGR